MNAHCSSRSRRSILLSWRLRDGIDELVQLLVRVLFVVFVELFDLELVEYFFDASFCRGVLSSVVFLPKVSDSERDIAKTKHPHLKPFSASHWPFVGQC
jgi:hypothetical protein